MQWVYSNYEYLAASLAVSLTTKSPSTDILYGRVHLDPYVPEDRAMPLEFTVEAWDQWKKVDRRKIIKASSVRDAVEQTEAWMLYLAANVIA